MRIYDAIKEIHLNNNKQFKAKQKGYVIKIASTGGITIIRQYKDSRPDTLHISGEIMLLDWQEIKKKPVSAIEALSNKDKKIRPVGTREYFTSEEWLLSICEDRELLKMQWEVE